MPKTHSKERIVKAWAVVFKRKRSGSLALYDRFHPICDFSRQPCVEFARKLNNGGVPVKVVPVTIHLPAPRRLARKATKKK